MAAMHPAVCAATANAGERAVFAALARFLDDGWAAWCQPPLPGRQPARGHTPTPLRADFVLLGPAGLLVIEAKGWRARSVVDADDSSVSFRNGARASHPLVQAFRYAGALAGLLREQPGSLHDEPVPVRYAAALPFVRAGDLGPTLPARLSQIPPAGGLLTAAQHAAIRRLFPHSSAAATADQPGLFDG